MDTTNAQRHGIVHQINAASFTLLADGSLAIDEARTPDGDFLSVELSAAGAFALAMFLRMPGVLALIEACNTDRQLDWQRGYEERQRQDAAMVAARAEQR